MSADNSNQPGSGSIESPPSEFPVPGYPLPAADDPRRAPSTEFMSEHRARRTSPPATLSTSHCFHAPRTEHRAPSTRFPHRAPSTYGRIPHVLSTSEYPFSPVMAKPVMVAYPCEYPTCEYPTCVYPTCVYPTCVARRSTLLARRSYGRQPGYGNGRYPLVGIPPGTLLAGEHRSCLLRTALTHLAPSFEQSILSTCV